MSERPLSDYTIDELRALPIYEPFGRDIYPVQPDGTVTLKDGRVLRGLDGKYLHVPRQQDKILAMFLGTDTPMMWQDEYGTFWRPVATDSGIKRTPAI